MSGPIRITRPGPDEAPLYQRVVAAVSEPADYRSSKGYRDSQRIGDDGEPVWPLRLRAGR